MTEINNITSSGDILEKIAMFLSPFEALKLREISSPVSEAFSRKVLWEFFLENYFPEEHLKLKKKERRLSIEFSSSNYTQYYATNDYRVRFEECSKALFKISHATLKFFDYVVHAHQNPTPYLNPYNFGEWAKDNYSTFMYNMKIFTNVHWQDDYYLNLHTRKLSPLSGSTTHLLRSFADDYKIDWYSYPGLLTHAFRNNDKSGVEFLLANRRLDELLYLLKSNRSITLFINSSVGNFSVLKDIIESNRASDEQVIADDFIQEVALDHLTLQAKPPIFIEILKTIHRSRIFEAINALIPFKNNYVKSLLSFKALTGYLAEEGLLYNWLFSLIDTKPVHAHLNRWSLIIAFSYLTRNELKEIDLKKFKKIDRGLHLLTPDEQITWLQEHSSILSILFYKFHKNESTKNIFDSLWYNNQSDILFHKTIYGTFFDLTVNTPHFKLALSKDVGIKSDKLLQVLTSRDNQFSSSLLEQMTEDFFVVEVLPNLAHINRAEIIFAEYSPGKFMIERFEPQEVIERIIPQLKPEEVDQILIYRNSKLESLFLRYFRTIKECKHNGYNAAQLHQLQTLVLHMSVTSLFNFHLNGFIFPSEIRSSIVNHVIDKLIDQRVANQFFPFFRNPHPSIRPILSQLMINPQNITEQQKMVLTHPSHRGIIDVLKRLEELTETPLLSWIEVPNNRTTRTFV